MSSLNSLNRNVLRISGMSSGLDTDTIVKSMMTSTLNKVNKQFRSQRLLEWKQEQYTDINNELRKLKDEFSTVTKQAQNMLSEYNYKNFAVKYANEGDSAYVAVSAKPDARESVVTIDYVKQLAKPASFFSPSRATGADGEGVNLSETLASVAQKLVFGDMGISTQYGATVVNFELDGQSFSFSSNDTLGNVLNTINARCENVRITYTQLTDVFTLESKHTGANSTLKAENNDFLKALGIPRYEASSNGQNAILMINGVEVEKSSNSFEIDDINYTLKKTFGIEYDSAASDWVRTDKNVSFTLTRDVDSTVDLIKNYIDEYNTLVRKLNDLLSEKVERDYYPLTEEEEGELTEKQLEKWEGFAKKGMMRNDSQLRGLLTEMRMSFYNKVPGSSLMPADIGLGGSMLEHSTQAYSDAKIGVITIDEDKLREAVSTNPDQVFRMFTYKDAGNDVGSMGLVTRVNKLIDDYIKNNENNTQYYNQMAIERAQYRYNEMLKDMYDEEDRLWARFTALEKTMSSLNAQQQWIGSQMGY